MKKILLIAIISAIALSGLADIQYILVNVHTHRVVIRMVGQKDPIILTNEVDFENITNAVLQQIPGKLPPP